MLDAAEGWRDPPRLWEGVGRDGGELRAEWKRLMCNNEQKERLAVVASGEHEGATVLGTPPRNKQRTRLGRLGVGVLCSLLQESEWCATGAARSRFRRRRPCASASPQKARLRRKGSAAHPHFTPGRMA
jgi:hypothetical protein